MEKQSVIQKYPRPHKGRIYDIEVHLIVEGPITTELRREIRQIRLGNPGKRFIIVRKEPENYSK